MSISGPLVSLVAELAADGQRSLTEPVRGSGLTFEGTINTIGKVAHAYNLAAPAEKTGISFWVVAIISPTTKIRWSRRGRARSQHSRCSVFSRGRFKDQQA